METLIDLIEDNLEIPYIEENDAVQDGCFAITPFSTNFLKGDGVPQASYNSVELNVFYESKIELMTTVKQIVVLLCENKFTCGNPSYTFDSNGQVYNASITVSYTETLEED